MIIIRLNNKQNPFKSGASFSHLGLLDLDSTELNLLQKITVKPGLKGAT